MVIDHGWVSGADLATTYNHLNGIVVRSGAVHRGQVIAYSGTTGLSTGCHLHFETLANGTYVNPTDTCDRCATTGRGNAGQARGDYRRGGCA